MREKFFCFLLIFNIMLPALSSLAVVIVAHEEQKNYVLAPIGFPEEETKEKTSLEEKKCTYVEYDFPPLLEEETTHLAFFKNSKIFPAYTATHYTPPELFS